MKPKSKQIKAFSMVELMVTIALTAVIMVMLSNILVNSISIAQRASARVFVREEIALITDLLSSDIKQASTITRCEGENATAICELAGSQIISWKLCTDNPTAICKYDVQGGLIFMSSANLKLNLLRFETGFEPTASLNNLARRNLLLSINGSHTIEGLRVNNIFQQRSVSTRNYLLP